MLSDICEYYPQTTQNIFQILFLVRYNQNLLALCLAYIEIDAL